MKKKPKKEKKGTGKKVLPQIKSACVHPLVLLHVVDHFNRMETKKRVVGVLVGTITKGGVVEAINGFAVPFDEDKKTGVYFLDHLFVEEMFGMKKRVSANEVVLGWYHSAGELCANDIEIHQSFRKYIDDPLLLVINVKDMTEDLPVKAYLSKKSVQTNSVDEQDTFYNLDVELGASEPEEIGVEHVLKDVQDMENVPTLKMELRQKRIGLRVLKQRLLEVKNYLTQVKNEKMTINQHILHLLQEVFNVMPDVSQPHLKGSITKVMNDQVLSIYLASIVRSVLELDALIQNQEENAMKEEAETDKKGKKKEEKETKKEGEKEKEDKK